VQIDHRPRPLNPARAQARRNSRNKRRLPSMNGKASDQCQSESAPTPVGELARVLGKNTRGDPQLDRLPRHR
jgi:hypothetical protein